MKKIHHDIEFKRLRQGLSHTSSIGAKIALLRQLVALNPRNPKNLTLRKKFREDLEKLRVKRKLGRKKG